ATGLRAAWDDKRVAGLISLGTPVNVEGRAYTYEFFQGCTKPKLFISGSEDQFSTEAALRDLVSKLAEPKKLVIVDGADHFFEGQLPVMQAALCDWVSDQFHLQPQAQVE